MRFPSFGKSVSFHVIHVVQKIFGSRNDRLVKQYGQKVKQINALEPSMYKRFPMMRLRAKTEEFKKRFSEGETLRKIAT